MFFPWNQNSIGSTYKTRIESESNWHLLIYKFVLAVSILNFEIKHITFQIAFIESPILAKPRWHLTD